MCKLPGLAYKNTIFLNLPTPQQSYWASLHSYSIYLNYVLGAEKERQGRQEGRQAGKKEGRKNRERKEERKRKYFLDQPFKAIGECGYNVGIMHLWLKYTFNICICQLWVFFHQKKKTNSLSVPSLIVVFKLCFDATEGTASNIWTAWSGSLFTPSAPAQGKSRRRQAFSPCHSQLLDPCKLKNSQDQNNNLSSK